MPQPKLTVVVKRQSWDAIHESLFLIDVLLAGLGRPVVFDLVEDDAAYEPQDDSLIINLCNGGGNLVFKAISSGCRNVGVIGWCHTVSEDISYYPFVDYVLRPYYSPRHFALPDQSRCAEIAWIPNGYKSGVGPRQPSALLGFADRPTEFFYSGFPNTSMVERLTMLQVVQHSQLPAKINITADFSAGLSINTYRTNLEQTRFALVPGGADPETIRLFEALELGAIPISLRHDFLQQDLAMAGSPIIQLESWADLPAWYAAVSAQPNYLTAMEEYRQAVGKWWAEFKLCQQRKVADVVNRSFARYGA